MTECLSRAKWLWPEGELYLNNCYAQFRHDFELKTVPDPAPLFLTADQSYRLYVNGRYVCRGPARGYQEHWPFDEVDVRGFLHLGHNWISVEAYNPGIGTFQYLHCDCAGMICAADWGEVKIATSKQSWLMRRAPGNNPNVARLSRQLAYQEDFDAARDNGSWITSPEPPVWEMEERFRWSGEASFGHPPWNAVEERGVPMLRETPLVPVGITANAAAPMRPGWENCFNIAWHWNREHDGIGQWLPGNSVEAVRLPDALEFRVEPPGDGMFRAITLDLGRIALGSLILELENAAGGEIIDCHYHQSLEHGVPERLISDQNYGMIAMATRLRAGHGRCRREFFTQFGCRQVTLVFRNLKQPATVRALWRTAEYPFSMRGRFECSDPVLERIVDLCRNTQQVCASDAYMDTPWREQGQWWGDARIQARNTFYLDGDARLLARGIRSIAGQPAPFGLTYGVAPCCHAGCILPDFSLTWILTIYDHWMQTGSLELFREFHDRIRRIFSYFDSTAENGVLRADPRFWLFEDWAELPKSGHPAFLNLWRLYTLEHYKKLLDAAGIDSSAAAMQIASLRKLLPELFFDARQGLFRASLEDSCPPSLHDQVLAILLNLQPEAHRNMAERRLLPFLRGERSEGAKPSTFWCSYLFEAARKLGCGKEIVAFIRKHWGRMIPSGGTWENFNWLEDSSDSCCHAWSAHPSWHLPDLFLGLRQLAPGWTELRIAPDGELLPESGRILLPLPPGDLSAEWNRSEFKLTVGSGTTVRFGDGIYRDGVFRFARTERREERFRTEEIEAGVR